MSNATAISTHCPRQHRRRVCVTQTPPKVLMIKVTTDRVHANNSLSVCPNDLVAERDACKSMMQMLAHTASDACLPENKTERWEDGQTEPGERPCSWYGCVLQVFLQVVEVTSRAQASPVAKLCQIEMYMLQWCRVMSRSGVT